MNRNGKHMKHEATFLTKFESATNFKGFEALHNTVLDIHDQLFRSDVQMEVEHMYDELWWSFKMFMQIVTNWH